MTTGARAGEAVCERIDRLIEESSLLKHPFYQAWQRGALSLEALQGYARQYSHFIRALPTYVSGTHANCDDPSERRQLLENLVEEEGGEENLLELWLRFGEAVGARREEVLGAEPLPETGELVRTYRGITKEGPFVRGIAALYAYEAQIPGVAATKLDGLKRFYGIDGGRGVEHFERHGTLDVKHSAFAREMVAKYATGLEAEEAAVSAADEASRALWGFLDGVHGAYVAA